MPRPLRHDRGFALIEALLSIALMAIVLAALATVTSQWLPNWSRGIGRVQQAEAVAVGLRRIGDDLASAEFIVRDPTSKLVQFDGQEKSVTLVRTVIGPNSKPGLDIVRYRQAMERQQPALVRDHARWVPVASFGPAPMIEPVVTLRGPVVVSLAYAGADQVWQTEWRDRTVLPKQIRIALSDPRSPTSPSMSTVVMLHVDAPAECVRVKTFAQCIGPADAAASQASTSPAAPAGSNPL